MGNNEKNISDIVCCCFARTTPEKLSLSSGNFLTSLAVPYYDVKLESDKLIFQKLIKGKFKPVAGIDDVSFEINLNDIKSFHKKYFIIGPTRNFGMPRFVMVLKSGEEYDIAICKKTWGVKNSKKAKEERENLINTLLAIK